MSNQETEQQQKVLVIIAGAFNFVQESYPRIQFPNDLFNIPRLAQKIIEFSYSEVNKRVYRSLGRIASDTELVVPDFLSIYNIDASYEIVKDNVLDKVSMYPTGTEFHLAGFSLGADMGFRFMNDEPDIMRSGVFMAGPHRGSYVPVFGPSHFKPFTDKTADIRRDLGKDGTGPVKFVGASFDMLVPPSSSLPESLPFVENDDLREIGSLLTNHLGVAKHRDTLETCREMMELSKV